MGGGVCLGLFVWGAVEGYILGHGKGLVPNLNVMLLVLMVQVLSQLRVQRLDKRVEGLDFLRGLLGPNSVGFKKGDDAKKRRQLLHKVQARTERRRR